MTLTTPDAAIPRHDAPWGAAIVGGGATSTARARDLARAFLIEIADAAEAAARSGAPRRVALTRLPSEARSRVRAALGLGEVACGLDGPAPLMARETALPGLWRVREGRTEAIEIGPAPRAFLREAHAPIRPARGVDPEKAGTEGADLVARLIHEAARRTPDAAPISVTLHPRLCEGEAAELLDVALGRGAGHAVARGQGARRIEATAEPRLWRVRHLNSQRVVVRDGFEIAAAPAAATATASDVESSAEELRALLQRIG